MPSAAPLSFGIVTPAFQARDWLPLCVASVADQRADGVAVHHHIQDGASTDGSAEWLAARAAADPAGLSVVSERDGGMYDAINRGFACVRGDILAHLNADEQYLPGALAAVAAAFAADPALDVVAGDVLVVRRDGTLVCRRHVVRPRAAFVLVDHLPTFTAALFYRRRVVEEHGLRFDPRWRAVADAVWMAEVRRRGLRLGLLPRPLTAFVDDGKNLGFTPAADAERRTLAASAPTWARLLRPLLRVEHQLKKLARGAYTPQRSLEYAIRTLSSPEQRVSFRVERPATTWQERW